MADTTQETEFSAAAEEYSTQLPFHPDNGNNNPPPPPPPFYPQTTAQPQDFGALIALMQQQIQGQNLMYQAQMQSLQKQHQDQLNQQKLQMETILSQNKAIDELKNELDKARSTNSHEQSKRPDRPLINPGLSDNQWLLFQDSWGRYKELANLSKPDRIRNELRAACSQEVNELLFELFGPQQLNSMTEESLLEAIKKVAVEGAHEEVHGQNFFKMKQDTGEPINKFVARLKAQANLCNFKVEFKCDHEPTEGKHTVSFTEAMLSHQLVSGLADEEWQAKMLAEADKLDSLNKKFDMLLSLEAVGKNTPQLGGNQSGQSKSALAKSSYKKGKQQSQRNSSNRSQEQRCAYCGQGQHARRDCPASNESCRKCNKMGHFASVCQSSKKASAKTASALQVEDPSEPHNQQPSMTSAAFGSNQDFRLGLERGSFL